ncbi:MAG: hypothetical protein J6Z14_13715 [Prevotella sp.]|nr:hypothetical protein [Prevotella sp.]
MAPLHLGPRRPITLLLQSQRRTLHPLGDYQLLWGFYRGDRIGIYNYNNVEDKGYIDVDYFHYDFHTPPS